MENRVYDLDVPFKTLDAQLLARILDAGYDCIAVSMVINVDDFNFSIKTEENTIRKKNKEERQTMRAVLLDQLEPPTSQYLNGLLESTRKYRSTTWPSNGFFVPRLLRRLTIRCSEPSLGGLFFREFGDHLNRFDIVSFSPRTSEAVTFACEQALQIDMISMETGNRLSGRQCALMLSRGIRLELSINPLLQQASSGTSARTNFAFCLTNLFSSVRPSFHKAIVVSSGATSTWEVRRPLAVLSMLQSLGYQPIHAARLTLTEAPFAVLTHGLWRSRSAHGAAALLKLLANPAVKSISDISIDVNTEEESMKPPFKRLCIE